MATSAPRTPTTRRTRSSADRSPTPETSLTAAAGHTQNEPAHSREPWDLREAIRDGAKNQLAEQKVRATATLGSISTAARETTRHLRDDGQESVARVVDHAVDRVETLARSLEDTELEDIARGIDRFARQQPALFMATAFGLGVVAARFFRSSAASGDRRSSDGIRT